MYISIYTYIHIHFRVAIRHPLSAMANLSVVLVRDLNKEGALLGGLAGHDGMDKPWGSK